MPEGELWKYYRPIAEENLQKAKTKLASGNELDVTGIALALRFCLEALSYERIEQYQDELSDEQYRAWQPRKVIKALKEIDLFWDTPFKLSMENKNGSESEGGTKDWLEIGWFRPLSSKAIKDHYDRLGSFLHVLSPQDLKDGKSQDLGRFKRRCEDLVTQIEETFSAQLRYADLNVRSSIKCIVCGEKLSCRVPPKGPTVKEAKCWGSHQGSPCPARYKVHIDNDGNDKWELLEDGRVDCHTEGCDYSRVLWRDEMKPGTKWTCPKCQAKYELVLRGTYFAPESDTHSSN